MSTRTMLRSTCAFLASLLVCASAHAQLFRAYLAPDGSDANPCTLQQPCRLLPAALTAVASGGEIWMLDSANYNTASVNVTKSVTILAVPGALGSVVAAGGYAINVTTGSVVTLRNLVIVPLPGGGGTGGINVSASATLTVENCLIANLPGDGITVTAPASVRIADSTIRDNGVYGLYLQSGASGVVARTTISGNANFGVYVLGNGANTTTADIANSTLAANLAGAYAVSADPSGVVRVSVEGSLISKNTLGMEVLSSAASATLSASRNIISNNGVGLSAYNSAAKLWASANTVSDNGIGLFQTGGAAFESAGNNAVRNNGTNKSGTISVVAME